MNPLRRSVMYPAFCGGGIGTGLCVLPEYRAAWLGMMLALRNVRERKFKLQLEASGWVHRACLARRILEMYIKVLKNFSKIIRYDVVKF